MSAPLVELTQRIRRPSDIEEVAKRGAEVLPNLITILRMGTDYNRACALACLIKMEGNGVEFGAIPGMKGECGDSGVPAPLDARKMRGELVQELRELLKSDNEYVRGYAATMLGKIRALEAIPEIAEGLGSRSHIVRFRCAAALILIGPPAVDAVAKLLDVGNREPGTGNRMLETGREARRVLLAIDKDHPKSVPVDMILLVLGEEAEIEKRRMGLAWKD
jgi:hypothetical protein